VFGKRFFQVLNLVTPLFVGLLISLLSISGSLQDTFVEPSLAKLLTPAPITFAIWGPIFVLMAGFLVYQGRDLLPGREKVEMPYVLDVGWFFFLSSLLTGLWYVAWSRRLIWTSITLMVLYYVSLLAGYFRLDINMAPLSRRERVLVTGGWSMYTGWITVATVVNTTTGLVYYGFDRLLFTELQWTIGIALAALTVYLVFLFRRNDVVFAGVGAWAFTGLVITHLDPTVTSNQTILVLSALAALTIIAAIIYKQKISG
jgi:hypothetical protein